MIFPCVVKDKDGKIKREYSTAQLSRRYWIQFDFKLRLNSRLNHNKKRVVPVSMDYINTPMEDDTNFYLP